ncbi:endonuclease/exonuclease/phosphatase family protein [Methanimicrococcus sp. OttesenSCG-928-J09]|nr:endonuclease/exonuclease/phosphatase family protein [Methanimicrococcus sp. OttesenSCG-928-J09]
MDNETKQNDRFKLVTWNCHQGKNIFIKKLEKIVDRIEAEIYIIQECPNPDTDPIKKILQDKNLKKVDWQGRENNISGVGIFIKNEFYKEHEIHRIVCEKDQNGSFFVSCSIDKKLVILGIWIRDGREKNKRKYDYANLFMEYLKKHGDKINQNYIVAGDFNIDGRIDDPKNTGEIFQTLYGKGLVSAYVHKSNEKLGFEKQKTYYNSIKPKYVREPCSHVDFVFADSEKVGSANFEPKDNWIYKNQNQSKNSNDVFSDHLPLIVEIKLNKD